MAIFKRRRQSHRGADRAKRSKGSHIGVDRAKRSKRSHRGVDGAKRSKRSHIGVDQARGATLEQRGAIGGATYIYAIYMPKKRSYRSKRSHRRRRVEV